MIRRPPISPPFPSPPLSRPELVGGGRGLRPPRLGHQALEAREVELARVDVQDIARRARRQPPLPELLAEPGDRKSTRLNSSHANISYAVFCLKKKKKTPINA